MHLLVLRFARTLACACTISAILSSSALSEERMVLGQKQFETDNGAGAVLCVWAVYLEVQATVSVCKLPRTETDDAIDAAILSMDDFIEANSSLHPTAEMLRDFKARAVAHIVASPQFCSSHDIEGFRSVSAEEIRGGVDRLLAVPREPVMNPCL